MINRQLPSLPFTSGQGYNQKQGESCINTNDLFVFPYYLFEIIIDFQYHQHEQVSNRNMVAVSYKVNC